MTMKRDDPRPTESAFAALIRKWMWLQSEPPHSTMSPAHFADLIGVARSTVINWLNSGARPEPDTLQIIAEKTALYAAEYGGEGIALNDLFEAARYPIPDGVWEYILTRLRNDTTMAQERRREVIQHIEELRHEYEARYGNVPEGKSARRSGVSYSVDPRRRPSQGKVNSESRGSVRPSDSRDPSSGRFVTPG